MDFSNLRLDSDNKTRSKFSNQSSYLKKRVVLVANYDEVVVPGHFKCGNFSFHFQFERDFFDFFKTPNRKVNKKINHRVQISQNSLLSPRCRQSTDFYESVNKLRENSKSVIAN